MSQLNLNTIHRRRYEHKATKTAKPEFIQFLRQAAAKEEFSEALYALFSQAVIENTSMASKKPCSLRISVARNNGNIFVNHAKKPVVEAYINPITNLLVREDDVRMDLDFDGTRDHIVFTPHHQFQMLAFTFAAHAIQDYIRDITSLSPNELQALAIKPVNQIIMELNQFFEDGTALYKNISEELTYLHTPSVPQANHFMAFADDQNPEYMVTGRVPYPNPMNYLDMDTRLVNRFLDAFFDETNKARFAWYMGAALRNIRVDDPSVSKMLMMTSAHPGSGKSTLVTALSNTLFTKTFSTINGDFDEHFSRDNRFSSESLVNTRMNVYLEAEFGAPTKDGNNHDFNQMKVSAIKTMITDGYMGTEEKYERRKSQRAFGFHTILTNHPAQITEETDALRRRILPCLVRASSMEDKARALGLFGQKTFETWVQDHALEFAVYFVRYHMEHAYDYSEFLYNSKAFIREINYYKTRGAYQLDPLALMQRNSDNIFGMLSVLKDHYDFDLEAFITAIKETVPGISYGDIRITNNTLYLNSAVKFLRQFTKSPDMVRDVLVEVYGVPEKKYQKDRFIIPMEVTDLDDFLETQKSIEAHEAEEADEVVDVQVFDKGSDVVLPALSDDIQEALELRANEFKQEEIHRNETKKQVREPLWMRYVDKSTLADYQAIDALDDELSDDAPAQFTESGSFAGLNVNPAVRDARQKTADLSREELVELVAQYAEDNEKTRQLVTELLTKTGTTPEQ
jgi:hypothetical protein